jgi:hypothetical protein
VLHERGQRGDAALDRFRREAQLDHPYSAHVYAFGDEDDGLFWKSARTVSTGVVWKPVGKTGES